MRGVLVEDNGLTGSMYGIRIKTPRGRGGLVQDIVFRNNRMTDVETPMVFSSYYESAGYDEAAVAERLAKGAGSSSAIRSIRRTRSRPGPTSPTPRPGSATSGSRG